MPEELGLLCTSVLSFLSNSSGRGCSKDEFVSLFYCTGRMIILFAIRGLGINIKKKIQSITTQEVILREIDFFFCFAPE